jgi:hypothetical protein
MSSNVEMRDVPLPLSIDHVSPEWLSVALGAEFPGIDIASYSVETVGTGVGLMGLLYRVTPEYPRPSSDYPDSVIIKLPVLLDGTRQVAAVYRHYEKEVRFYAELAQRTSVATAAVYHGTHDVTTDNFVLIMEDLGHLRTADQVAGCDPEDAKAAMVALARHHASFWDDPAVVGDAHPWLPFGSDPPIPQGVQQGFDAYWAPFVEFMADGLDPRIAPAGEWVPANVLSLLTVPDGRPSTVVHGDFRLDNILFDDERIPTVLDWQIITKGAGGYDFAYFISQSFSVEARRTLIDELATTYLTTLRAEGIEYTDEDFWSDVRRSVLFCLFYQVQIMALDLSDPRTAALVREMANRSVHAIIDLGALSLIR